MLSVVYNVHLRCVASVYDCRLGSEEHALFLKNESARQYGCSHLGQDGEVMSYNIAISVAGSNIKREGAEW